ncbi:MAG: helix-turn-helix transcriptional regulator [Syntrophomonadaceae bacterium]|nr:helix-turn-helix transcriptional regulator [Syntrophomonadaceae bacterium]
MQHIITYRDLQSIDFKNYVDCKQWIVYTIAEGTGCNMRTFDREKFAQLLQTAQGERSLNKYALESGVTSAHISRLLRCRLDSPPSPQTLEKLAACAHNEVSYEDFMIAAGYLNASHKAEEPRGMVNKTNEIPRIFGERLREVRKEKRWTTKYLAMRLRIPQDIIEAYENSEREPEMNHITRISELFDLSSDWFLGIRDARIINDASLSPALAYHRIDNIMKDLPEEARNSVEEFISFVYEKYGKKED